MSANSSHPATIGDQLRKRRMEMDLTLTELANRAEVSKGYLSALERNQTPGKPSGETIYKLAKALGTTMSDLMGKKILATPSTDVPASLQQFANANGLSQPDIQMLAAINFRGQQPHNADGWAFIWRAVRASVDD